MGHVHELSRTIEEALLWRLGRWSEGEDGYVGPKGIELHRVEPGEG